MKKYLSLLSIGLILVSLTACTLNQKPPLKVGLSLEYPPFEYSVANNEFAGIDVELARSFAKERGQKVEFIDMPFADLLPAVKKGQLDLVISAVSITEQRIQEVDFTDPYLKTYPVLLINNKTTIQSGADLNKQTVSIGVTAGTTGEILARNLYANAIIIAYESEHEVINSVISGQVDVIITDLIPALKAFEDNKNDLIINPTPLSDDFEYWGIVVKKGNLALRDELNAFLKNYRESGKMKELIDPYLEDIQDSLKKFEVPLYY